MSRRRRQGLSSDDLDVWRQVARTATPLRPASSASAPGRPPAPDDPNAPRPVPGAETPRKPALPHVPPRPAGPSSRAPQVSHDLAPTLEGHLAAQPLRMDKKAFARLKRGKLRPERKLDLHGMTLADAHPALNRFIRTAHADGLRLVIVVTGKGRSGRDEGGPIPTPRGVLRHQVPGWLQAASLRPYVLQVTDAHLRHGGSGAYYVYLRRGPGGSVPRG